MEMDWRWDAAHRALSVMVALDRLARTARPARPACNNYRRPSDWRPSTRHLGSTRLKYSALPRSTGELAEAPGCQLDLTDGQSLVGVGLAEQSSLYQRACSLAPVLPGAPEVRAV